MMARRRKLLKVLAAIGLIPVVVVLACWPFWRGDDARRMKLVLPVDHTSNGASA